MSVLSRIITQFATILGEAGVPAEKTTLYALILIYLLVSFFLAVFLFLTLFRRHLRRAKKVLPQSDLES